MYAIRSYYALALIKRDRLTLKGVVHSAMVLDDGFVTQLDPSRMMTAIAPKVAGAWHLHEATAGMPLDFFVMYSSLASSYNFV